MTNSDSLIYSGNQRNMENCFWSNNSCVKNLFDFNGNNLNQKVKDEFLFNINNLNSFQTKYQNTLLIILDSIVMSVIFFCRLMLVEIIKFANVNEAFFLDSLIKYVNFF